MDRYAIRRITSISSLFNSNTTFNIQNLCSIAVCWAAHRDIWASWHAGWQLHDKQRNANGILYCWFRGEPHSIQTLAICVFFSSFSDILSIFFYSKTSNNFQWTSANQLSFSWLVWNLQVKALIVSGLMHYLSLKCLLTVYFRNPVVPMNRMNQYVRLVRLLAREHTSQSIYIKMHFSNQFIYLFLQP